MADTTELDKMHKVHAESQVQGELLEWLDEQGIQLMSWKEWDEKTTTECMKCYHGGPSSRAACTCRHCNGTHEITTTRHYEEWVHERRSTQQLLADYHGIDLDKVEKERRAILAGLRSS